MHISELPTSPLVIDADRFDHNVKTMADQLPGARLRPHVKAHKPTLLAAAQRAAGHPGFTCATFAPARPLRVGDRVELIPAHVDPTMALHEVAWLVRNETVIDRWQIDLRGW